MALNKVIKLKHGIIKSKLSQMSFFDRLNYSACILPMFQILPGLAIVIQNTNNPYRINPIPKYSIISSSFGLV